jgi:hypothetical protein
MAVISAPPSHPSSPDVVERSYFRSVAVAWLVGVPAIAILVAALVLVVGDVGIWGAIAVGVFAGIWVSPLAGVLGIGRWAAKHHGPHG